MKWLLILMGYLRSIIFERKIMLALVIGYVIHYKPRPLKSGMEDSKQVENAFLSLLGYPKNGKKVLLALKLRDVVHYKPRPLKSGM
ncbi:hypothetical protein, partial [Paenibacillus sp. UNC451MF]|uniref:hypothetical protein n=1 Tax=Paenibacillus sp. UNC451MF TaxID=1449063 RepID=UPI001E4734C2